MKNQNQSLKYNDLISLYNFIKNIVEGFFRKWNLGILFLDINVEQGKINIDLIIQDKIWDEFRNKDLTKKFNKKERKNNIRIFYIKKNILNKYFKKSSREILHVLFYRCKKSYLRTLQLFYCLRSYSISKEYQ